MKKTVLLFSLALALTSCDKLSPAPKQYTSEDCIIEGMKGVQNDLAARAVATSCRERYKSHADLDQPAPPEIEKQITGNASLEAGRFAGILRNESDTWTITQVVIQVKGDTPASHDYTAQIYVKVKIAPKDSASFSEALPNFSSVKSWSVFSARGVTKL